ncbi:MAG: hypothetical protein L0G99_09140 [Propionibacteriales bacterium]|nr:hypothetical protein [Propionibacteriales bacterium]
MSVEEVAQHKRWIEEVRDPATANAEPEEVIRAGKFTGTFLIAPIPGGWAYQADAHAYDGTGGGIPWSGPLSSRDAAIDAALHQLHLIASRTTAAGDGRADIAAFLAAVEARRNQPDLLEGARP